MQISSVWPAASSRGPIDRAKLTAKWFWIAATFCVLIAASLNASAAAEPIVISPATLPDGRVGEHYDRTLMASAGAGGPYTFALTSGVTPVSFSSGGSSPGQ